MQKCWTHVSLPVLRYRSGATISNFGVDTAYSPRSEILISTAGHGRVLFPADTFSGLTGLETSQLCLDLSIMESEDLSR